MYNACVYHGTNIDRGRRMIENSLMEESMGDRHWLGDGSYFYEDDFYAFKWIRDMFKNKFEKQYKSAEELFEYYMIITGILEVKKERVFDLENPRYKIQFDKIFQNCKAKQEYSERFKKSKVPDGVVINIMFNKMDYKKRFDIVIATFKMREDKYEDKSSRLGHMPEKQICVKNLDVFKPKDIFECKERIDEFEEIISNLNFKSEKVDKVSYNKSNNRNRVKYVTNN